MSRMNTRLSQAAKLAGILLLGEALWFALLHPLVPSTLTGFAMEFAAGIVVAAVIWGTWGGMWWLAGCDSNPVLRRFAAVALSLSVGIAIFLAAYLFRETLGANFQYFIFARH